MLLIFLLICVTSSLGSLFSLQKSLNLVFSTLDIILVYVIPYLNVFSPLYSFSDQKVRAAGRVELWAHHGFIKRNNYICSLILYLFPGISKHPQCFSWANCCFYGISCYDWEFSFWTQGRQFRAYPCAYQVKSCLLVHHCIFMDTAFWLSCYSPLWCYISVCFYSILSFRLLIFPPFLFGAFLKIFIKSLLRGSLLKAF